MFFFIGITYILYFFAVGDSLALPRKGRITGGQDATIEDFPFMVSMSYYGEHHCGGAILNSNTVITSAACFHVVTGINKVQIRAGASIKNQGGILINVTQLYKHPHFNVNTANYDVAILKLEEHLTFNEKISQIGLATETPRTGQTTTVIGWGRQNASGEQTTLQLQQAQIPIFDHERCVIAYEKINKVTENMLCAGLPQGGLDACAGDSGGPLVFGNQLVGIVSWGNDCGLPNYPGVYANVVVMKDWILSKL